MGWVLDCWVFTLAYCTCNLVTMLSRLLVVWAAGLSLCMSVCQHAVQLGGHDILQQQTVS
jgi:hypothetical protein